MSNQRGQSTVEYAVLAAVVIAALIAMQVYVKRGAMGKLKESADQIGSQFTPLDTTSSVTRHYDVSRTEDLTTKGVTTSKIQGTETQKRTDETETVGALPTQ